MGTKKKTYRVVRVYTVCEIAEIEANNEEDAIFKAQEDDCEWSEGPFLQDYEYSIEDED